MATLAALLKNRGFDVRGSDQNVYPPMSDFLRNQGITTLQGYDAAHITADIDLVIVGNAISRGNVELEEVLAPTGRPRPRRWRGGCWRTAAPTRACSSAALPRTSRAAIALAAAGSS